MNEALEQLDGYQSLVTPSLRFAWNVPFRAVRDGLQGASAVRQIEEQGVRLIRFEETLPRGEGEESIDLQNELYFNPDYGYGVRSAAVIIEGIDGRSHLKQEGSYRPLVRAYFRLYRELVGRFGEPTLRTHLEPGNEDALVKLLDHTREQLLVTALWSGRRTQFSHELQVSYAPRHLMRISAVGSKLIVQNQTGKGGVGVDLVFSGGHSESTLAVDGEKTFDLPIQGDALLTVRVGEKTAELKFPLDVERCTISIRRAWLSGTLSLDRRPW
ncbi:MAG TPA: hypothetical protein VI643_07815 [Planctomycetota bacterium]|nr:hypothetical protein [Planctomycetota bacterium]